MIFKWFGHREKYVNIQDIVQTTERCINFRFSVISIYLVYLPSTYAENKAYTLHNKTD